MSDSGGLREQKRAATRLAIQLAALRLTAERGLEQVTVDDVSQAAGVSPRTFFNYFATKEEAITGGIERLEPTPEMLDEFFAASGDVVEAMTRLLVRVSEAREETAEVHHRRREVFTRHPELLGRTIATAKAIEAEFADFAAEWLRRAGQRDDAEELERRSRIVAGVALAVLRSGWAGWAHEGGLGLEASVAAAYASFSAACEARIPASAAALSA